MANGGWSANSTSPCNTSRNPAGLNADARQLAEPGRLCFSPGMPNRSIPSAHYDRTSDILYVAVGPARDGDSVEHPRGVVFRYQFACNEPIGATVIGYRANGWSHDRATLAAIIADHIRARPQVVANAIQAAAP